MKLGSIKSNKTIRWKQIIPIDGTAARWKDDMICLFYTGSLWTEVRKKLISVPFIVIFNSFFTVFTKIMIMINLNYIKHTYFFITYMTNWGVYIYIYIYIYFKIFVSFVLNFFCFLHCNYITSGIYISMIQAIALLLEKSAFTSQSSVNWDNSWDNPIYDQFG